MSVFSATDRARMRAVQEAHMSHRAVFHPWSPEADPLSGQHLSDAEATQTIRCGVNFSARGALVEGSDGSFVAHYQVRLPREFAQQARPLSRYVVTEAFGELLPRLMVLEQASEPSVGPSGVVVWARNVTV